MKKISLRFFIVIFLIADFLMFGPAFIALLSEDVGGGGYSTEVITDNNGENIVEIYDETLYIHHEPDWYHYTVYYDNYRYFSFNAKSYETEREDDYIDIIYDNNGHNFRVRIHL
ncbi:MAG: hypothetical protein K2N72_01995 [Oscillospiraceae bacterium]|nr:hypothetical protein [Oscillospiraceae bacterium]